MSHFLAIFKKVFESMVVAWIWLLMLVIHIIFFSSQEPSNIFELAFDRIVLVSCFLLYPFSMNYALQDTIWPFTIQFIFWWVFGFIMILLYKKLSKKSLFESFRKK